MNFMDQHESCLGSYPMAHITPEKISGFMDASMPLPISTIILSMRLFINCF